MPVHVTKVIVDQVPPEANASGFEVWRVSWTERRSNGKTKHLAQTHCSRGAARRHVRGLLSDLAPGTSRDDVLTLNLRDE